MGQQVVIQRNSFDFAQTAFEEVHVLWESDDDRRFADFAPLCKQLLLPLPVEKRIGSLSAFVKKHRRVLMLVKKYHDTHCQDKSVLIDIRKAVDASPELRSKKDLIETFIAGVNNVEDVMAEWHDFVAEEREKELVAIIQSEQLKEAETRRFIDSAFRDGEIKTTGTDIDGIMPPTSRFGGGSRAAKKQSIIEKLNRFFERFFGIG